MESLIYAPRLPVACCLVIAALLGLGGTIVGPGFRHIARQRSAESDAVAAMSHVKGVQAIRMLLTPLAVIQAQSRSTYCSCSGTRFW